MATTLHFSVTERVRASNDAVWAVLGNFGTEHRWTRTLTPLRARHSRRTRWDRPHVHPGAATDGAYESARGVDRVPARSLACVRPRRPHWSIPDRLEQVEHEA